MNEMLLHEKQSLLSKNKICMKETTTVAETSIKSGNFNQTISTKTENYVNHNSKSKYYLI